MGPSTVRPFMGAKLSTTIAAAPVARFSAYLLVCEIGACLWQRGGGTRERTAIDSHSRRIVQSSGYGDLLAVVKLLEHVLYALTNLGAALLRVGPGGQRRCVRVQHR